MAMRSLIGGSLTRNGGTLTPEARAQTNMKHKGTMYEPLIQLAILSYTFDVMHCKLRVIPKLWRWTSKNGKKTTTTERKIHDSWAGAVCSGLMDNHVKILQRVHGITSETPESEYSPEYKYALRLWGDFIFWCGLVAEGCDDRSLESRTEHGRQLRVAAERFLATHQQGRLSSMTAHPEELEAACWRDAGEDEAEAEELSDEDEEGELVVEHQANSGLDDLLSQSGSVAEHQTSAAAHVAAEAAAGRCR
eukprot:jgi/Tetstr1/457643/TSEL_044210.t1